LVNVRLDDAWALLRTGQPQRRNGAIYLGGYSVECALKARICEDRREKYLDAELFTHDLHLLAAKTSRWARIQKMQQFEYLESEWSVTLRYKQRPLEAEQVKEFLSKAKDFGIWLFGN
jgi:hypothetical protein